MALGGNQERAANRLTFAARIDDDRGAESESLVDQRDSPSRRHVTAVTGIRDITHRRADPIVAHMADDPITADGVVGEPLPHLKSRDFCASAFERRSGEGVCFTHPG